MGCYTDTPDISGVLLVLLGVLLLSGCYWYSWGVATFRVLLVLLMGVLLLKEQTALVVDTE